MSVGKFVLGELDLLPPRTLAGQRAINMVELPRLYPPYALEAAPVCMFGCTIEMVLFVLTQRTGNR